MITRPLFSVYVPVKNDWDLVNSLVASARSKLRPFSWEIVLTDDGSDSPPQVQTFNKSRMGSVRIFQNQGVQGVVFAQNMSLQACRGQILIPFSADMEFFSSLWPWKMFLQLHMFRRADVFFAKCLHIKQKNGEKSAVTGWAKQKGLQKEKGLVDEFCSGETRISGYAVAFHRRFMGGQSYDPQLGPQADFYLNHLALLTRPSFYWGRIVTRTLERPKSFSKDFAKNKILNNHKNILHYFKRDGVKLTPAQRMKYLNYEIAHLGIAS